ncbi:MAG: nickel pincer cofactor biosynthesis protein LarC [Candidatus Methanoplasma sp.]|jgi:uncharacterized protein (TIGR00299 family) protein|nr:nickel pincer cofactor biosynthesis protein LarC [Candidatus Methanoplasma sp.]
MRTLYIECGMGAAGDMLMAALFELTEDKEGFLRKMNDMGFEGVRVCAEPSVKCGIRGTYISVTVGDGSDGETDIAEMRDHRHRDDHENGRGRSGMHRIEKLLSAVPVPVSVREHALSVYRTIAEAESHVHGCPVDRIHFHEVGDLDAVTDIVGVCLLIDGLRIQRIVVSPVNVGSGCVRCAHGVLPVPAPATAHILRGVPCYGGEIKGELCTPTGAALLKHFADGFGAMPEMRIEKIGYGMGKHDFESANCLRAFLGDTQDAGGINGYAAVLECNVDDMTGEAVGFACRTLMHEGAHDVFTSAADMKTDRPGVLLTCICDTEEADKFAVLILRYTTTFGVRRSVLGRYTLDRTVRTEQTSFGEVRVKTGTGYGVKKAKLEYGDTAELAAARGISVDEMERMIWSELNEREER